ncbi:SDR family NAD(P)-dependent oxidoreductase [Nocardia sp. NBC_00508]|uniref:SDR family NAD(P)-dependent oxidoreductase n=1 Tax=Nocardia sp. NBC_00508 TaxID=2975992 RepID=UPI003FA55B5D
MAATAVRIGVRVLPADLSDTHGVFAERSPERVVDEIAVNVGAVVALTHALLPGMVARGRGAVVNVASTAAFQPIPYMAVYGATKAFVLSFTEALWGELDGTGVEALALCPGATDTEFFEVTGEAASVGGRQTPARVAATAMKALDRRNSPPSVVSGLANKWSTRLPRVLPRRTVIRVTRGLVAPK